MQDRDSLGSIPSTPTGLDRKQPHLHSGRTKRNVFLWSTQDVLKWLQRFHSSYFYLYGGYFKEHEISGRILVQLSDYMLFKMGIDENEHRLDILERIARLRLKHEQAELKLLRRGPVTPKAT